MSLVFCLESDGPIVILTDDAIASMIRHRQNSFKDREAGGQLFGRFEGNNTVIVAATEPKAFDTRSRYGFIPNQWLQRLEIKAQHKEGKHYVGDWHTHPQRVPLPSSADINSMIECFRKSHHELKAFLMVIVGTAEPQEGFFVCLVDSHSMSRLKLTPTSY